MGIFASFCRITAIAVTVGLASSVSAEPASAPTSTEASASGGENGVDTSKLPNILECDSFDWMENCETINEQAKRNPNAPIRAVDSKGHEFNFPPGTPSVVISFMLDRSQENAAELANYLSRTKQINEQAAATYRQELAQRGGSLEGFAVNSTQSMYSSVRKETDINPENVKIYMFFDSKCKYCHNMFPVIQKLKRKHPDLFVSMLQLNKDKKDFEKITAKYNFKKASIVSDKQLIKLRMQGVKETPTIWISDTRTDKTQVVTGLRSYNQIINLIAKASS